MSKSKNPHLIAAFEAFFVTILWSSSWIFIKIGLRDIPAITFAGIRYFLAFISLFPFLVFSTKRIANLKRLKFHDWMRILFLGLIFITITQGTIFIGLSLLPAVIVGLLLSSTPFFVTFLGQSLLSEKPTIYQWIGLILFISGIFLFFHPIFIPQKQILGFFIVIIGVFANAGSSILGRAINKKKIIHPIIVTIISMGFGSILLLIAGFSIYGLPILSPINWLLILWLSVVNTAFAFTLWNHTLRTLSAMESSIINNTMLFQIAVLAWIFFNEAMNLKEIIGMVIAGSGAIIVQIHHLHDNSK
jgi:drug/metabolite transporter (DMT)-like permease